MFFLDEDEADTEDWKVVVDPDCCRLKPSEISNDVTINKMGDDYGYWHFSTYHFRDWDFYENVELRTAPIALVRGHLGEIRYDLPVNAR